MKQGDYVTRLFFFISIAVLTSNCNNKTSSSDAVYEKIMGSWDWVQSVGGMEGSTLSPATEGYKITITFEKNGIYREYRDEKETIKMKFSVTSGKSIYTDTGYLVSYKNPESKGQPGSIIQSVRFGENDTLFLGDECYDCFEHIYTRKN